MLKEFICASLSICGEPAAILHTTEPTATSPTTTSTVRVASYSAGYVMGKNLKSTANDLIVDEVVRGLRDGFGGKKTTLTDAQMEQAILDYQTQHENKIAQKNALEGKTFLAKNAKRPGVITTASGLQYKIIKQGKGKKPKATDTVAVKYTGKLLDGSVFDSTEKQGDTPAVFPLNQVIPGWTEGVQLMNVGSKYRFYIPSTLAYGEQGAPSTIPANSTLIFDIELLQINPPV